MNQHTKISPQEGNLAKTIIKTMEDLLRWKPLIERALHHVNDMYSFDNIVEMVMRKELHFYNYKKCCVLMSLNQFPNWSSYHCFLACGSMDAIKEAEADINKVAKSLGCKYMSISGRTGWPRALKKDGC